MTEGTTLWLALRVCDRAGHASAPPPGGGSIGKLRRALDRLDELQLESGQASGHGGPTVAVTGLMAGSAPNVLPAEAKAVLDARFSAAERYEDLERRIADAVGPEISVERIAVMSPVAGSTHTAVSLEASALVGEPVNDEMATYFTDLSKLAKPDSATVILGPGQPNQAHAVDERCSVEAIATAARVFYGLLA